jgi:hypothetical protein
MSSIMQWAGIVSPVVVHHTMGEILPEIRLMEAEAGRLLVVFNREDAEKRIEIAFPPSASPRSVQPWTEGTPVALNKDVRVLTMTVPARRVSAVFLE